MDEINDLLRIFSDIAELTTIDEINKIKRPNPVYDGLSTTLIVTDECNLRCTYCYCNKAPTVMSWSVAQDFIDFHFEKAKDYHKIPRDKQSQIDHRIVWDFIGGEPLLEASLIFKCMDYIEDSTQKLPDSHPWKRNWPCSCSDHSHYELGYRFMIGTNGLLLNDASIQREILKRKSNLHIAVTLDGDQEMHDLCRVDTEGKGSFDRVIRAWHWLRNNIPNATTGTKSTIAHENVGHIARLVKFFYKLQPTDFFLSQNCVFENVWHRGDHFTLFNQLCDVADFLLEGRKYETFMVRWFDVEMFTKTKNENNWCGAAEYMSACDHTGTIYPCIRFKHTNPPFWIGDVKTGIDLSRRDILTTGNPILTQRQTDVTGLPCKECPISSLCSECQSGAYNIFGCMDIKSPFLCPMHRAAVFANIYFFGKLMKFTSEADFTFKSYLIQLLDEYTKDNYFGYDEQGRSVQWQSRIPPI